MTNSVGSRLSSWSASAALSLLAAFGWSANTAAAADTSLETAASRAPVRPGSAPVGLKLVAEAGAKSEKAADSDKIPDEHTGKEKVVDKDGALAGNENLLPGALEDTAKKRPTPKVHEWKDSLMGIRG